ncbi:unnamed protein product, partial [Prorocentrum cordatum]
VADRNIGSVYDSFESFRSIGEPALVAEPENKERVKWYVAGLSYRDKAVAGARLASALTGEAWKVLEELLENNGGHKTLLQLLDETLMDEPIWEAAKYLKEYLFTLRRKNNEGMKAYAQRSRVVADKLDQSFRRIEEKDPSYELKLQKRSRPEEKPESVKEESSIQGDDDDDAKSWKDENWRGCWRGSSWFSSSPGRLSGSQWERFDLDEDDVDIQALKVAATELRETFIPSVMAGWLLLQRAGLNAQERAGVLSSATNLLNLKNIKAALRNQWADANRKRDMSPHKPGKGRAMGLFDEDDYVEQGYDDEHGEGIGNEASLGDEADEDNDELDLEDLDEDDRAEAEEALAVIAGAKKDVRTQKRTLAQARAVVKDIKQSRGLHQQGKAHGKGRPAGGKGQGPCFICGGAHNREHCSRNKEKNQGGTPKDKVQQVGAIAFNFGIWDDIPDCEIELSSETVPKDEDATEVAFTSFEKAHHATQGGTVEHALAGLEDETAGCTVLDCGATKTSGSIRALEQIIEKQQAAGMDTSGVTASGQLGTVAGHALHTKNNRYVPLVGSVDVLRRSGAIIDFAAGTACFAKPAVDKLVRLKRISTGHLCIDVTWDIYGQ